MDDAELMALARRGDREAFGTLVKRHQKMLLNFFVRMGVQHSSEDLAQQTFVRLYRYRDRYVANAKFTTFLFLLARQVWVDELRRRGRRERLVDELAADPALTPQPECPARRVAGKLDVAQALETLPEGLRMVVELGVYQDLPYAEIAEILGIPVGTVKSRMFTALARLRTYFEKA